jgi:hypothetical protein
MNQYVMMKRIADVVMDSNGAIFGGYVRDKIIHDNNCKKFWRQYPKATQQQYEDPDFHPETADRLLIPSDIDAWFADRCEFDGFVKMMAARYPVLKMQKQRKHFDYTGGTPIKVYKLIFRSMPLKQFIKNSCPFLVPDDVISADTPVLSVCVDVIISEIPPSQGHLDYECNGLVMRKDSITVSCDVPGNNVTNLIRIMDDIKGRVAVEVNFIGRRFNKMYMKYGWVIRGGLIERPITMEGECLLCMTHVEKESALKLACCSALYHSSCLERSMNTEGTGMFAKGCCFHCRRPIETSNNHLGQKIHAFPQSIWIT